MKVKIPRQILYMSRLLFYGCVLQCLFISVVTAATGHGQSMHEMYISIDLKKASVQKALSVIEHKTEFRFLYNAEKLDRKEVLITARAENISLADVLGDIAREAHLKFKRINNTIVVDEYQWSFSSASLVEEVPLQQVTVSGVVTSSEDGLPLPGVSILIKGSSTGTTSDVDGRYAIAVSAGSVLQYSYIGFEPQEVEIGNQTTINISLKPDLEQLEEVVVVGYGTRKRSDLTGSIVSVNSRQLEQIPAASFDQKLQGQVAGVQVTQSSGAPGGGVTIRVRGTGSATSGNEPLYVIDGVPLSNRQDGFTQGFGFSGGATLPPMNPLATLNPNDIESIEVLKDASATAIYGSRGANGVIIITTKRGRNGKPSVQIDLSRGVQTPINTVDVLNGREMAQLRVEARRNGYMQGGGDPAVFDADPTAVGGLAVTPFVNRVDNGSTVSDTDWQDEIFNPAPITNLQASVRGGNENVKYFVSGNYFDQEGYILGSSFERFSARANVDMKVSSKLKLGLNFSPSYATNDIAQTGGRFVNGNIVQAAVHLHSFLPVYDDNGDYVGSRTPGYMRGGIGPISNPVALGNHNEILLDHGRMLGNATLDYEIVEGLTWRTNVGTDLNFYRTNIFESQFRGWGNGIQNWPPTARSSTADDITWLVENTISYNKEFNGGHRVDLVAGHTAQQTTLQRNAIDARNLPNDDVPYPSAGIVQSATGEEEQWALESFLFRANYSFKNRYLLTASVRRDGSSRFSENNRYGTFPSLAFAWKVDQESFMQGLDWLDGLKLRASWGETGNFEISNYASFARLSSVTYVSNGQLVQGAAPITPQNNDLTWENTTQSNIGVDLNLFKARLNITADYYVRTTTDMLLLTPVPAVSGFGVAIQNIGEIENRGWEFTLSTVNVETDDFVWESSFNISQNRNKVLALGSDADELIGRDDAGGTYKTVVGRPMSQFWGYVSEGVFMNQSEVDAHAFQNNNTRAGDRRFADLDGDGDIDGSDQTFIGDPNPDFIFGFSNTLRYKGFDFNMLFTGVQGNDILNGMLRGQVNANGNLGQHGLMRNRWRSETDPGDGDTHRVVQGVGGLANDRWSSYFVEDGSFIRLRNLSLGYTFTNSWLQTARMEQLRVYFTGTNLLTLGSDYRGFDPEGNSRGNDPLVQGSDLGTYPIPKIYTLGISATF